MSGEDAELWFKSGIKCGVLSKRSRNRSKSVLNSIAGANWQGIIFFYTNCLLKMLFYIVFVVRKIALHPARIDYGLVDGTFKGVFPLDASSTVTVANMEVAFCETLMITAGTGEDLLLTAASTDECAEWIVAIDTAIKELQKNMNSARAAARTSVTLVRSSPVLDDSIPVPTTGDLVASSTTVTTTAAAATILNTSIPPANAIIEQKLKELYNKVNQPIACMKKLSTESSAHQRYIWVYHDNNDITFRWAKDNTNSISDSKSINICTQIKEVKTDLLISHPNLTIVLDLSKSQLPFETSVFKSTLPTSIEIILDDSLKNYTNNLIEYMNEMRIFKNSL
jgi:hypothetical protein